jgi:hypothetical protein
MDCRPVSSDLVQFPQSGDDRLQAFDRSERRLRMFVAPTTFSYEIDLNLWHGVVNFVFI